MKQHFDEIIIHLPKKAEYVGFIRLTVSGLLSKVGFDIDTVEDIKVVVSEICNKIVSSKCKSERHHYDVKFHLFDNGFKAFLKCQVALPKIYLKVNRENLQRQLFLH